MGEYSAAKSPASADSASFTIRMVPRTRASGVAVGKADAVRETIPTTPRAVIDRLCRIAFEIRRGGLVRQPNIKPFRHTKVESFHYHTVDQLDNILSGSFTEFNRR
jgi:hypothetical protein